MLIFGPNPILLDAYKRKKTDAYKTKNMYINLDSCYYYVISQ